MIISRRIKHETVTKYLFYNLYEFFRIAIFTNYHAGQNGAEIRNKVEAEQNLIISAPQHCLPIAIYN